MLTVVVFDPVTVFETLYENICRQACRDTTFYLDGSTSLILPSKFCALIKGELQRQFPQYLKLGASEAHRRLLYQHHKYLAHIKLEDTCISCCARRPDVVLPCGHSICETCKRIFSEPIGDNSNRFRLERCLVCGVSTGGIQFRTMPRTAAPRVLSLDGGGIRGLASLQFLQVLQDLVGLPYPIQHHFDIVYGTSSGKTNSLFS